VAKAVFEQCERALPIGLGVAGEVSERAAIVGEDGSPDVVNKSAVDAHERVGGDAGSRVVRRGAGLFSDQIGK
jgi:hypothetical protein